MIAKATSGSDGMARFEEVTFGKVWIKEIQAPDGYNLYDEVIEVTIDENWINGDDQTRTIIIENEIIPKEPPIPTRSNISLLPYAAVMLSSMGIIVFTLMKRKKEE